MTKSNTGKRYKQTPEFINDVKTMTRRDLAKKYGMTEDTATRYRKKYGVGRRFFRIDDTVDALMSSSLAPEDVARALRMSPKTIKQYRVMYRYREPEKRTPVTPEIRQRVIEIGHATIAARVLGIGRSSAREVLIEHGEAIGKRLMQRYTTGIQWPEDPAWWEARTVNEIAAELGVLPRTARRHIRTKKLVYKRDTFGRKPKKCA